MIGFWLVNLLLPDEPDSFVTQGAHVILIPWPGFRSTAGEVP
jgi:hypothetical protein